MYFRESLLVGFSTTNSTRAWEPTLSWNQLHSSWGFERNRDFTTVLREWMSEYAMARSATVLPDSSIPLQKSSVVKNGSRPHADFT
jgi:hypothetical protein